MFCSSVTITVLDEVVREKVLCIHTKLIIVCRRLREVKRMSDCSWSMFVVFAAGAKTVKMFHFARLWYHLKKSVSTWQFPVNKVIKFRPCWEAPYLWLVTYWQWHYRISWENGGRITKTPALIAGAPFPFPSFVLFSLPPAPSPFCACQAGYYPLWPEGKTNKNSSVHLVRMEEEGGTKLSVTLFLKFS